MPLALLAAANSIIGVIQQGCEMYTEYKGTVAKAQKTFKQVQQIHTEVKGFWSFLKDKIFGPKEDPPDPITKAVAKAAESIQNQPDTEADKPESLDELSIYNSIAKNLIKYYHLIDQVQEKLREAEERSRVLDNDKQNLMEDATMRVLITEQLIKMSADLRTVMCWNTPTELGALYEKVEDMRKVIISEQAVLREDRRRKELKKKWLREQRTKQLKVELAVVFVGALMTLEIWALLITLSIHQPLR